MTKVRITPTMLAMAKEHDLRIEDLGHRVEIYKGKKLVSFGVTPTIVLGMAITRLETDKIPHIVKPTLGKHLVESIKSVRIVKGSIIDKDRRASYKKNGMSNGDMVARELKSYTSIIDGKSARIDLDKVRAVATANDVWDDSYHKLNPGLQRMTIGNKLRNKINKGLRVKIGQVTI